MSTGLNSGNEALGCLPSTAWCLGRKHAFVTDEHHTDEIEGIRVDERRTCCSCAAGYDLLRIIALEGTEELNTKYDYAHVYHMHEMRWSVVSECRSQCLS